MGKSEQVAIQLDDVMHGSSRSLNCGLEIFKHLPNLRSEVVLTDDVAGLVEGHLAGDED